MRVQRADGRSHKQLAALCLFQPLSRLAATAPRSGSLLGGTMCQDIRVNTPVGTRSPYSLPFVILPVPARSPFRLLVHRTRSTPNLPSLHRPLGALGSNPPHAGTAFGWSYHQPALKGEVANEVRRRGYKEACISLSVSTPQSRHAPCQLPVRGA